MRLPRTSTRDQLPRGTRARQLGFTVVELLVVIGIIVIAAAFGLFVSMDFYRGYSFSAERMVVVAALEQARNRAMNNYDESAHGVHFESGRYVVFHGPAYVPGDPRNEVIAASPTVSVSGPADIAFSQLSGEVAAPGTVTLTSGARSSAITINHEGSIDW